MGADPRCVVEYVATYSTGTFSVLNVVADPGVAADPRFLTVCDPTNLYGGTGGDANGDQKMARVDILVVPPFGQQNAKWQGCGPAGAGSIGSG